MWLSFAPKTRALVIEILFLETQLGTWVYGGGVVYKLHYIVRFTVTSYFVF